MFGTVSGVVPNTAGKASIGQTKPSGGGSVIGTASATPGTHAISRTSVGGTQAITCAPRAASGAA